MRNFLYILFNHLFKSIIMEKLWEECQITYKGKKYNLATNEFYTYIEDVFKNLKSIINN